MKFFCEYCGNRIDASKDSKCPGCGATYRRNKEFLEKEAEIKKEKQVTDQYKHQIINHAFSFFKFSKLFLIIPIVIFFIIITIAIIITVNINKKEKTVLDETNSFFDSVTETIKDQVSKQEEENVTVNLNEYASTSKYKAKVTKYEVVKDRFNKLEEGYELVKFHLVVENISGKELTKEDVNCIVDGIAQNNDFSSGYSDLPMFINKDLAVKGTATFEVPKDATSYDIKYGDYITIHIEK